MLCERCRKADVTVYVTEVFWPGDEPEKHEFCDVCYAEAEAERSERFRASFYPPTIPAIDPSRMTALEYLDACERAVRNRPDRIELTRLMTELAKQPAAHQRLVFETLPIIWRRLAGEEGTGRSIYILLMVAGRICAPLQPLEPQPSEEYAAWAEKIILRCYERSGPGTEALPKDCYAYRFGVLVMLAALHKVDPKRTAALFEALKWNCLERGPDLRWEILAKMEKLIAAKKQPANS